MSSGPEIIPRTGGVVLCGGRSSRMGTPKASLMLGDRSFLARVTEALRRQVSPVVVVAAADQQLPAISDHVIVVRDEQEYQGPLAGIGLGLRTLDEIGGCDAAYVSGCDTPLLLDAFVRTVITSLGEHDLVIPRDGESFYLPLAAVYRTKLHTLIDQLILSGQFRPISLLEHCDAKVLDIEAIQECDPYLNSITNANNPEQYSSLQQQWKEMRYLYAEIE